MSNQDFEVRLITEDEWPEWERSVARGFGAHSTPDARVQIRSLTELDRALGTFHRGKIVGSAVAHSFELTIPGGHTSFPLVDAVTVLPTHRRRGLLTAMMERQLADFRERGEFLAGLTATEGSIYERFGYGIATWGENWKIVREHARMAHSSDPTGETRFVEPDEMRHLWPQIYERVWRNRVGMFSYNQAWWDGLADDPESWRRGASAFFHVVYEANGIPEGFVSYRLRDNIVGVIMLLGTTLAAETALWSYCFGIDLMTEIRAGHRPLDDPLPWMLADTRRLERSVRDELWLRLVDVPAALQARSYEAEVRAVIQVRDQFCPWNEGRYELEVSPDGATCKRTTESPDLELDVSELGAVYLGGTTLGTLLRSGRVKESKPGIVARLDRALAVERAPWVVDI